MPTHALPAPEEVAGLIAPLEALEGPLLPMLHRVQETYGYLPQTAHDPLCKAAGITRAELAGVISFYHDFKDAPQGRHVLRICRAEACQSMGGAGLAERLLAKLGLDWHGTTPDGRVTVEPVYCLGLCACAPAVMVDDTLVGRADEARVASALAEVRA
ncbi:formate dehydrogenase subunit gamma [Celeribacter indicus]|uniref:Formate dehydrogenase subunit gamma n=1 Tax=Celeribacter indicus TaxID=1208324 RepID=A0A0B5DT81_9RHOB|nr:formate dehydrogenase subunit gamma [Celeribacter indicus]AJE46259.1 formate dehydrogenase subunit gamma [Celeribacter indicus]SDW51393.1 formate dehydrogenase gamma subunit [Celeribacter indicus]